MLLGDFFSLYLDTKDPMDTPHLALKNKSLRKHPFLDLHWLDYLLGSAPKWGMVAQVAMGFVD